MPVQTRWGAAFVLIFAGVISALQVGKAAIAVPILQRELALTLVACWSAVDLSSPARAQGAARTAAQAATAVVLPYRAADPRPQAAVPAMRPLRAVRPRQAVAASR